MLLFLDGKLVLEEYFYGYHVGRPQQMRSASKAFVGALAGIAVGRGAIASAESPVLPMLDYPAYAHPDPRKPKIRLHDLLTMSSGLACDDYDSTSPGRETAIYETPDWVKATLDLPMAADPGSMARYCSGGVKVVGRVVHLNPAKMADRDNHRRAA